MGRYAAAADTIIRVKPVSVSVTNQRRRLFVPDPLAILLSEPCATSCLYPVVHVGSGHDPNVRFYQAASIACEWNVFLLASLGNTRALSFELWIQLSCFPVPSFLPPGSSSVVGLISC